MRVAMIVAAATDSPPLKDDDVAVLELCTPGKCDNVRSRIQIRRSLSLAPQPARPISLRSFVDVLDIHALANPRHLGSRPTAAPTGQPVKPTRQLKVRTIGHVYPWSRGSGH